MLSLIQNQHHFLFASHECKYKQMISLGKGLQTQFQLHVFGIVARKSKSDGGTQQAGCGFCSFLRVHRNYKPV